MSWLLVLLLLVAAAALVAILKKALSSILIEFLSDDNVVAVAVVRSVRYDASLAKPIPRRLLPLDLSVDLGGDSDLLHLPFLFLLRRLFLSSLDDDDDKSLAAFRSNRII